MAKAPLRVSLAGGGSDLPAYYKRYGGRLIAGAIRESVTVRLSGASGVMVRDVVVGTTANAEVVSAPEIRSDRVADLPPTLVRAALGRYGVITDVCVTVSTTCPPGSGLGRSGALAVALLAAAAAWTGHSVSPERHARDAFTIEHTELGRPLLHRALVNRDVEAVGTLMDQHWQAKAAALPEATNPAIDSW